MLSTSCGGSKGKRVVIGERKERVVGEAKERVVSQLHVSDVELHSVLWMY